MTNTDRDTVLQYSLNSEVKIRERYSAQKTYTCHLFYAVVYSLKHGFFAYSHGYSHSLCDVWMYKYEGSGWDTRLVWWNVVYAFHNRAETSKGVRKRIRYHAVCQPRPQGLFPRGLNWGGWEYHRFLLQEEEIFGTIWVVRDGFVGREIKQICGSWREVLQRDGTLFVRSIIE